MMKKAFILAEHKKGHLKKSTLELLNAAKGLDVAAAIFGSAAEGPAKELAEKGVQNVYWIKDPQYDNYHPEAFTSALHELVNETKPFLFLGNSSSFGKDVVPKLAARLNAPVACDCTELELEPTLKVRRPFFSGKATAALKFETAEITLITIRPNSLPKGQVSETPGKVNEFSPQFDFAASPVQFIEKTEAKSDKPDLTEADIIVSGGRSLQSQEKFQILEELADVLGAAVGASRAAVDEGMAEHSMQVGQTGKTVNPSLYIACGISGAIQHLAGMRTSKVIVAINRDENAPIFSKADYGIVGDLFTVVPLLTQEFKKLLHKH